MDRISTSGAYNAVLANMMSAQQQQLTASNQLSSQQVSTDLQGYGGQADTLTAMQAVQAQVTGFLNQSQITADKLTTQNSGLTQIASAASGATQVITSTLASGVGDTLMQQLQAQFQNAADGLNTTQNGEYVFAGGQVNTQPFSATSMSQLTTGTVASFFKNDNLVTSSQISQNTTIKTGFLANQLGSNLMTVFQNIQAYAQANGPFTGTLTTAQQTFLQGQIASLNTASAQLNTQAAQNGQMQAQVTSVQTALTNQQTTMTSMIGNITDANMAQVSANLQEAQLALQASAQVFVGLQNSSLLTILQATGH